MTTQVIQILLALKNKGTSTYAALEKGAGIPLNKLRWAVNDLKQRKLVIQKEDHISNAIAWQITPAGLVHLTEALQKAERPPEPRPKAPAKAKQSKPSSRRATPAAGGACNSGSSASESLVEAATTSPEGTAVVEQPEPATAPVEACSNEIPSPHYNPDSVAFARWSVADDDMQITIDHKGQLTIDSLRFSPDETRRIGQFLINTEPAWN